MSRRKSTISVLLAVVCALGARAAEKFVDTPEVLRLAAILRDRSSEPRRIETIRKLADLGPEGAAAAPALIEVVRDPLAMRTAAREEALVALAFMAPAYDSVVPALIGELADDDFYLVVCTLMKIGRPAVGPLLAAAGSRMDPGVRRKALEALAPIRDPRALQPLAQLVANDKSHDVRSVAAECLGELGEAAAPVAGIIAAQFGKGRIRDRSALKALGHIGPKARAAVPLVAKSLETPDPLTKGLAAFAFFRIVGGDQGCRVLEKELKSADERTRDDVLFEIMETGPAAAPAVPMLLGIVSRPVEPADRRVLGALGEIGQGTPEVLDLLREARASQGPFLVAEVATTALALCGEIDRGWVASSVGVYPQLRRRRYPYRNLVRVGRPAVKQMLTFLELDRAPVYRWLVVQILRDIGPDAAEALPVLKARLAERDPRQKHSWRDAIPEAISSIEGKPAKGGGRTRR